MFENKVLTERDFSDKTGHETALEKTLNRFAAEGWRLVESFVAEDHMGFPAFSVIPERSLAGSRSA